MKITIFSCNLRPEFLCNVARLKSYGSKFHLLTQILNYNGREQNLELIVNLLFLAEY